MAESESNVKDSGKSDHSAKKPTSTENIWQKNVLCRFYKNGMCNKGSECIYSHDRSLSNRGTLPCKYFSTGTCAYGDNCRFSHELPFPGTALNTRGDEHNSTISETLPIDQTLPIENGILYPTSYPNDATTIDQYRYTYESPVELQSYIIEDTHTFPNVPSETNSFYNDERIGGEDSGVGEDLTYQFDASLNLDQVPNLPENHISSTPSVFWAHRSITPIVTSPYSPPPYSDTSWADAPVFVPNQSKSPSITTNSHNAISPTTSKESSKITGDDLHYSNSTKGEEQIVMSEYGSHSVMPQFFENSYNMPHIPLLIPSNTTVIGNANPNNYYSGLSIGVMNLDHGNTTQQPNNHFPNFQQQPIMSPSKRETSYNGYHSFTTSKHQELPPPPPPPTQSSLNESSDLNNGPPKAKTWAQVVNSSCPSNNKGTPTTYKVIGKGVIPSSIADAESQLCPFSLVGECRYGEHCAYVHGLICDLCGTPSLHPNHEEQRKRHQEECMNQHEADMELAFAHARSKDKVCGICMEVVMDKSKGEARFGIMPNCNHCYCLSCLRKWRQAKQFEHKIVRACPECRQTSDYICPSRYWVDTKEEKDKLLSNYKLELMKKECKYYDKGNGECPFGNKCFYRHEDKNGKIVDVGPPSAQTMNRPRLTRGAPSADDPADADGVDRSLVQRLLLFDFLEERDGRVTIELEEFLDILDFLSDAEESEDSTQ